MLQNRQNLNLHSLHKIDAAEKDGNITDFEPEVEISRISAHALAMKMAQDARKCISVGRISFQKIGVAKLNGDVIILTGSSRVAVSAHAQ